MRNVGLALLSLLFVIGCTATQVAEKGMPQRGPASGRVELSDEGDLKSVEGEYGGGSSSVLHIMRKTWYENGQPKSDTTVSSDPTLVQQTYFAGVREQSTTDMANFASAMATVTQAATRMAELATTTYSNYRVASAETPLEREDRLLREAKRDARLERMEQRLDTLLKFPTTQKASE